MKQQLRALQAELIKNKRSPVLWVTFTAFALGPVMGGVFMLILRRLNALAKAGGLSSKARAMDFTASWDPILVS